MFEYSQHKDTNRQKEKNDSTTITKDRQTELTVQRVRKANTRAQLFSHTETDRTAKVPQSLEPTPKRN